jgi:hypothetical protein
MTDTFITEIQAIDPETGDLKTWAGPKIKAISYADAEAYCQNNGLGYCKVVGKLVSVSDSLDDGDIQTFDRFN